MEFLHGFRAFYVFYVGICHKPASKGINIDVELNFCFGHNREWNLGAGLWEPIRTPPGWQISAIKAITANK